MPRLPLFSCARASDDKSITTMKNNMADGFAFLIMIFAPES
jgi:hypothetical protein